MYTMDTGWFRDLLAARKISQRTLAKMMEMDHSAVSLLLRGKRRMQPEEAHFLAQALGVKTTEVLRRAGVAVRDDVQQVPITSFIDCDGDVVLLPDKTHDSVAGPADCPKGTYAVQVRCHSDPTDGWLVFTSPTQTEAKNQLDKLCLVAMKSGKSTLAVLRRGYRTGTFNLISWPSRSMQSDVTIAWASPVLWIKSQ